LKGPVIKSPSYAGSLHPAITPTTLSEIISTSPKSSRDLDKILLKLEGFFCGCSAAMRLEHPQTPENRKDVYFVLCFQVEEN
jgi:hypothetical protein